MAKTKTTKAATSPHKTINSVRRAAGLKGLKGGAVQKEGMATVQKYATHAFKTAKKIGAKGGTAALVGGAAGMVLGGMAVAAMMGNKTRKATNDIMGTAESISRHAEDLKKISGKK